MAGVGAAGTCRKNVKWSFGWCGEKTGPGQPRRAEENRTNWGNLFFSGGPGGRRSPRRTNAAVLYLYSFVAGTHTYTKYSKENRGCPGLDQQNQGRSSESGTLSFSAIASNTETPFLSLSSIVPLVCSCRKQLACQHFAALHKSCPSTPAQCQARPGRHAMTALPHSPCTTAKNCPTFRSPVAARGPSPNTAYYRPITATNCRLASFPFFCCHEPYWPGLARACPFTLATLPRSLLPMRIHAS